VELNSARGINAQRIQKLPNNIRGCGWLVFAVTSSAIAWGLSDADYDYLRKTHNLERYDHPVLDLSPRERSRIHELITDSGTARDPAVRDKNVEDALALFLSHQLWEKEHLGRNVPVATNLINPVAYQALLQSEVSTSVPLQYQSVGFCPPLQ
jgi:hypothetical protein